MIQLLLIDSDIKDTVHVCGGNEFNIHTTTSPLHTLNLIIKLQPDAIIINISNAPMDLCRLLKRIRNMQAGKELPFILLYQKEEELEMYREDPHTSFLPCGSSLDMICSEVATLLKLQSQNAKKEIAVIDDDVTLLEIAKLYLSAYYNITTFSKTADAMDYLASHTVQLILLDVAMPDMDGRTLFTKVRELSSCKEVPILFQTGMAGMQTVQDCLSLGPAGYIIKPLQKKNLLKKVNDALNPSVLMTTVKKKIALLDSNPLQHTNIKDIVAECSLEYESFIPSIKGFSQLDVNDFQYIAINMENSSSWLSMLRNKMNHHNLPVILLTTMPDSEAIFNELSIYGTYVVKLPVTKEGLLEVIQKIDEDRMEIQNLTLQ